MPLNLPKLDDRSFDDLRKAALERIQQDLNTDWNDLSAGDPGVVLLEVFAYLTEQMIYRLNRLPEKVYIAFLRLLGVSLYPPAAAKVQLSFWHNNEEANQPTLIPLGTQISMSASRQEEEPPIFVTAGEISVPPESRDEKTAVRVSAYHCQWIRDETLGTASGHPGLSFTVQQPPIVVQLGEAGRELDLVVGVEVDPAERIPEDWTGADGKPFRIWQAVDNFANLDPTSRVYVVDREAGTIRFAPAARMTNEAGAKTELAAIPPAGREIRVWYPRGGGEAGNVPAGTLDTIVATPDQSQIEGVAVINPERATGGLDAETLDNALIRGPHGLFSLERAVTARDFERIVLEESLGAIARAKASAKAGRWKHAVPGTVEIDMVPSLPKTSRAGRVMLESLHAEEQENEKENKLTLIGEALAAKSPLGTRSELNWARYKQVWVRAELVIGGNEGTAAVQQRVTDRLYRLITPLPTSPGPEDNRPETPSDKRMEQIYQSGWPFGQPLEVAYIYRHILDAEKDVTTISALELVLEHAPDRDVKTIAADYFQPNTWYAGSGHRLFRSTNDGEGWELMLALAAGGGGKLFRAAADGRWQLEDVGRDEAVRLIRPSPNKPGLVALATEIKDDAGQLRSPLYLSGDCGETWYSIISDFDSDIEDIAWMLRANRHILLLATGKGLFEAELSFTTGGIPRQATVSAPIPVIPGQPAQPLYAVTVMKGRPGNLRVVVAAKSRQGLYISDRAELSLITDGSGRDLASNFRPLGLRGEDIRHLNLQQLGNRIFLWAGAMARADTGRGCYRWQFDDLLRNVDAGRWVSRGWDGGSCHAVAFQGTRVLAVTAWGGVLVLDFQPDFPGDDPAWQAIKHEELPHRRTELEETEARRGLFVPLITIASNDQAEVADTSLVMVGGEQGIYRSRDRGRHYEIVSRTVSKLLKDTITIPENWLLISGPHDIVVRSAGETAQEDGAAHGSA